jgi:Dual specificity phosphatase, catalytic domain
MADFNFVTPRLATGAAISSAADVDQLAGEGITLVIDCRGEFDDAPLLAGHPSMLYVWDGTDDDGQTKPAAWFDKGIAVALSALARPSQRVYCHCAAGVNRGPSMAYAVMRALGWSAEDGEAAIRRARPQVGLRYKADADVAIVALGYG